MAPETYTHLEQDFSIPKNGDELPTYDDLAVQGGPNSRYVTQKMSGVDLNSCIGSEDGGDGSRKGKSLMWCATCEAYNL